MNDLSIEYIKTSFVFFVTQLISGSGFTMKAIIYSLLGAAVLIFILKVISFFAKKEKGSERINKK